jgi:hypothetical protein
MMTAPNIADPDGFYETLLDAHAGLTSVLRKCIAAARDADG